MGKPDEIVGKVLTKKQVAGGAAAQVNALEHERGDET
jgi:hypothetical protein